MNDDGDKFVPDENTSGAPKASRASRISSLGGRVKPSYLLAALLAIGVTAWVASGALTESPPAPMHTAGERAGGPSKPVQVRVAELNASERPRHVVVTGRTNAIKDAEIKAETSGQVIARPARKGTVVEKGTVLLRLAMDDRQARLDDARARLEEGQITFNASKDLQRKQFESQIKLAQSKASLASAKAALAAIELDVARTEIRAPIDGFIETLLPGPGDYVEAGDMVAMVVDLDPVRVIVNVTERDVADIKVDDLATVKLPNGREIGGTVHYVSRVANDITRTFRIDIWIDNPDNTIPAGVTAEVLLTAGARIAHKVPSSALTLNGEGALGVRSVNADDTVEFHKVTLIEDTSDGTWVAGLPNQVRVITVGQEFVTEGQAVAPTTTGVVADTKGGDAS